jgi:receptor expression-enhancing protein 5/6
MAVGLLPAFFVSVATPVVQLYAGLMSFRALQSDGLDDDKQWLTFWLLFSLFEFAAMVLNVLGGIIPFYVELKLGGLVFLGFFKGAQYLYPILEPFLLQGDKMAAKYEALAKAKIEEAKKGK